MRCCCDVLEVTKIHRNSLKCYGPWSMVHGPYPSQACWESWLFGFPLPKKPACARKPHETSMFLVFCFGCYSCFSPHDVTVCPHPRWCGPLCGWLARSCVWTAIMSSSFSVFFAMHSGTGVRVSSNEEPQVMIQLHAIDGSWDDAISISIFFCRYPYA